LEVPRGSRHGARPGPGRRRPPARELAAAPAISHRRCSSMNTPEQSQLGKPAAYADRYDASLLFPISRRPKREELGLAQALPFFGADLWTAFELSWLTPRGKPQVAIAHLTVPCETPNIVESKSFKLYLN